MRAFALAGTDAYSSLMSVQLSVSYRSRPIRFLELWQPDGWRLKLYGIAVDDEVPRASLVTAAREAVLRALPTIPDDWDRYDVGWVVVHDGRDGVFVLLDWWGGENMMFQRLWMGPRERPAELTPAGPLAPTACVWELAVAGFERRAWIEHVLANPEGPDLDGYLSARLSDDV
jgi:hypothetical protein